jgi:hypothetical protein
MYQRPNPLLPAAPTGNTSSPIFSNLAKTKADSAKSSLSRNLKFEMSN